MSAYARKAATRRRRPPGGHVAQAQQGGLGAPPAFASLAQQKRALARAARAARPTRHARPTPPRPLAGARAARPPPPSLLRELRDAEAPRGGTQMRRRPCLGRRAHARADRRRTPPCRCRCRRRRGTGVAARVARAAAAGQPGHDAAERAASHPLPRSVGDGGPPAATRRPAGAAEPRLARCRDSRARAPGRCATQ